MEQRIPLQAWQFLWSVVSGIAPAMFYDFIRGLEQELPWFTRIGDLLTGLVLLLGNVLLLLYVGDGEYRCFFPVGALAGYILWRHTGSKAVRRGGRLFWRLILFVPRKITTFLKIIVIKTKKILKTPFSNRKKSVKIIKHHSIYGGEDSG